MYCINVCVRCCVCDSLRCDCMIWLHNELILSILPLYVYLYQCHCELLRAYPWIINLFVSLSPRSVACLIVSDMIVSLYDLLIVSLYNLSIVSLNNKYICIIVTVKCCVLDSLRYDWHERQNRWRTDRLISRTGEAFASHTHDHTL